MAAGACNTLDGLQIISGSGLIRYYTDNIENIYQLETSHIISALTNKNKEHLHALRSNLVNKIRVIFPAFNNKRLRKVHMIEKICKDIHILTTCIVKNEDTGLANMFLSKKSELNEDLSNSTAEDLSNTMAEDLSNTTGELFNATIKPTPDQIIPMISLTDTAQPPEQCPANAPQDLQLTSVLPQSNEILNTGPAIRINDLGKIPDKLFVKYFDNNLHEIFKHEQNSILNKLEVRSLVIIEGIRQSLLTQICKQFPDFTPISAKRRGEERHLICKDIYILGVALLSNTTRGLASVYQTETHRNMHIIYRQTPASTAVDVMPVEQQVQSEAHSSSQVISATVQSLATAGLTTTTEATQTYSPAELKLGETEAKLHDLTKSVRDMQNYFHQYCYGLNSEINNLKEETVQKDLTSQKLWAELERLTEKIARLETKQARALVKNPAHQTKNQPINPITLQLTPQNVVTTPQPNLQPVVSAQVANTNAGAAPPPHGTQAQAARPVVVRGLPSRTPVQATSTDEMVAPPNAPMQEARTDPGMSPPPNSSAHTATIKTATIKAPAQVAISTSASAPVQVTTTTSPLAHPGGDPVQVPSQGTQPIPEIRTTHPQPQPQAQNNMAKIKRGPKPKQVDKIFISQVHASYSSDNLKAHINQYTGIDIELIQVEQLSNRDNNKSFKIVVPEGKMKQTIEIMGRDIKAVPYLEQSQRMTAAGQARNGTRLNNPHRGTNSSRTFHGPPPARRPAPRNQERHHYQQPHNYDWTRSSRPFHQNQWQDSYQHPEWHYYEHPQFGY